MAANNTLAIRFLHRDIISVKAGACVTSVHRSKDMTKGPLASQVLRHGGQSVKQELSKVNGTKELEHGQVAMIPAGHLASNFKQLMVVCLYCWREGNDETLMIAVSECLEIASQKGFESIVFPALGMGGQKYPPFNVAMAIMAAIVNFRNTNPESSLKTVNIALYDDNENSIRTFLQTSIAFIQGVCSQGNSDVDLSGVSDFNGLESTRPPTRNRSPRATSILPSPMEMVNFASRTSDAITFLNFSTQMGDFDISVSPNFSIRQRSLGLDLHIGFNFERFLPRFINRILPRA